MCDGAWIASLVDYLCGLFCKLAVLADSEDAEEIGDVNDIQEDMESSENKNIELAQ